MKYYVYGDYSKNPCEGFQVISSYLYNGLSETRESTLIDSKSNFIITFLQFIKIKKGTIIFSNGPGYGTFLLTLFLNIFRKEVKIIWIMIRPTINSINQFLINKINVNLIFSSRKTNLVNKLLKNKNSAYIQNLRTVDFNKFKYSEDLKIRENMRLHGGHIRPNRSLELLIDLKNRLGNQYKIKIVASNRFHFDKTLYEKLLNNNIDVDLNYYENLSHIYRQAICYIFPLKKKDRGAVDLPLSIVESLACKTPVISTDFGDVKNMFDSQDGVFIIDEKEDFIESSIKIINSGIKNGFPKIEDLDKKFNLNFLFEDIIKNNEK